MPAKPRKREERAPEDPKSNSTAAAGQAGDLQGLSDNPEADSESVTELLEEGQSFEAGIVDAVESAPEPDVSEVKTKEPREDDVPQEYVKKDQE